MARQWRNQGQVHSDGQQEAHRDGESQDGKSLFYYLAFSANGAIQDCGAGNQDEGLQQGGSHQLIPDGPGREGEVEHAAVAQPVHRHPQHPGGPVRGGDRDAVCRGEEGEEEER